MGGVTTPELAAAVSKRGGLGVLAGAGKPPEVIKSELQKVAEVTSNAVGVNFLMPFLNDAAIETAAATGARVIELFYGDPSRELVDRVRSAGSALVAWQVGSVGEAKAAADAGADIVIVQGREAGGHVRGDTPLLELLRSVAGAFDAPVVAAGGISTPQDVRGVIDAGAAAARVGTRFVTSSESAAHPEYIRALLASSGEDTVLTTAFATGWPDAPHRVLRSCVAAANALPADLGAARFLPSPPTAATTGRVDAMALYAGAGVGSVERVQAAADIVDDLVSLLD